MIFVLRCFFFLSSLLNKNLAICSGKRRAEQEKKREKKTSCLCINWLGRSWGVWWPITDMTFESANFKMSETGESENLPECTMEETPPPCCTTDTEDCQVKIQIQHLWSFTLQLLPCLISSYPFPLIIFFYFKQPKSDGQLKKKLKVGLQLNLIIKTPSL